MGTNHMNIVLPLKPMKCYQGQNYQANCVSVSIQNLSFCLQRISKLVFFLAITF